ncbi:hypothetical protein LEP1GSC036_3975 [Leptospira weilii str. 2006001853]|uniref:Uncharacterized protein n=4 Tax=Leptospira weilii TaxID=28184 RepID=A0A828Z8Q8_9LEPT|nr:hypothetical protein LEP1GSC036_3975 [Leptospira weilii str. 2006001853]EMJ61033.1 hypothetical protein LEP1GSC051_2941 [Leptospira sp. P2653]EMM74879.1 hypothetical protein LEP1GSC038_0743 [Leptospira weilii str. 2006001855]EMN43418.1 hypothetical protein LEP1GSC086_1683 [Leptospira weilii str. LNT 1234]EMN88140.1 hypothetical protein LEP1GSC108_0471 [Leptospira weilii str. UI 13098]EMY14694.1 hypothetical protein LEP1GSC043_2512 [Leptospira weilii str. Ecochallenge]
MALNKTTTFQKQPISFFITPGHDEYSIFIMESNGKKF